MNSYSELKVVSKFDTVVLTWLMNKPMHHLINLKVNAFLTENNISMLFHYLKLISSDNINMRQGDVHLVISLYSSPISSSRNKQKKIYQNYVYFLD